MKTKKVFLHELMQNLLIEKVNWMDHLFVSKIMLSKWKNGTAIPSSKQFLKIINCLSRSTDALNLFYSIADKEIKFLLPKEILKKEKYQGILHLTLGNYIFDDIDLLRNIRFELSELPTCNKEMYISLCVRLGMVIQTVKGPCNEIIINDLIISLKPK